MQIEEGDESSDFTIRSGEEIGLELRGNVKPMEEQSPVIKFIRNGFSLAHVQLHLVDSKNPRGYILMIRKDILIDWKRLNWGYLVEKYEGKLYEKSISMRYLIKRLYSTQLLDYVSISIQIYKSLKDNIKSKHTFRES